MNLELLKAGKTVKPGVSTAEQPDGGQTALGVLDAQVGEDHLRVALDSIPALLHTAEPDGSLDYFNQRWLDYLGVSLNEIKGWGWTSRIHPAEVDDFVRKWRSSLRTGEPLEAEARVRGNDGVYRWMIHRKVPLRDQRGTIIRWYGSTIDIDELRRSEFYLAEGQRLGHAGSWSFKPDGTCDYWSRELYEILGFDPNDGIPTISDYLTRVHPQDREFVEAAILRMIAADEECDLKKRIIRPDGVQRVIRCVGMPVTEEGVVTRFVGTLMDITEQEELTQELRRREAYLAEAQRLSHTGSWGWNASTGKVTWSQEHFRILGLDPQYSNPSLDAFWEIVHPDDRISLQRTFESAIRDKRNFEQEFRVVRSDSSIRYLHGVGHAIFSNSLEFVEFIGTTVDVTERKRAEAALQEARAELERVNRVTTMGELAASIAHEVNQPLAGVVTSANAGLNWLAANPPNLAKTREALQRILRDGTRGGEVLAQIRGFLKRTLPARTLLNLNRTVGDVLALVSGELRQHHIELSLELAPTLPGIHGDSIQLQQVLLNLIKNAVEAMTGIVNGERTLGIRSRLGDLDAKPAVVVEVSDTGIGFGSTETSRLFEAFHTTKPHGMGMGLWISRSIIENHAGRLTASARGGTGATFVIMLPIEDLDQA